MNTKEIFAVMSLKKKKKKKKSHIGLNFFFGPSFHYCLCSSLLGRSLSYSLLFVLLAYLLAFIIGCY